MLLHYDSQGLMHQNYQQSFSRDFPGGGPVAKTQLPMQGTWVRFLGQEDPLEKEMAIHSSILAWKIPWTEEPCRL